MEVETKIVGDHERAVRILANLFADVHGRKGVITAADDKNARAALARLAQADPPLLLCTPDEMK